MLFGWIAPELVMLDAFLLFVVLPVAIGRLLWVCGRTLFRGLKGRIRS